MRKLIKNMWPILSVLVLSCWIAASLADVQDDDIPSDHGNSIETDKIGLPIYTTLNGSVTNLNYIRPKIHLNRTKAFLNCSQGSMQVELMFDEEFYGVAYADYDRNSACMTRGNGSYTAKIELPLKGCGTVQDPPRVFTNNIVVRFHPSLEMDGDEVITIVCRYPPAIARQPGPNNPAPYETFPVTSPALTGLHLLLIICSLVFLTLLLTGLGCSYMCLKNRVIGGEIHRQAIAGSEITKFSGSTFSHISMFTGYKIPRALVSQQNYGSEAHLVMEHSDTLPSDYPSESHSEVDEERSLPVSSAGSYENKAFIHQQSEQRASSSLYSENINEIETTAVSATRVTTTRHPVAQPIQPKFDVQMRVKQAPPPPSPMPSESEASVALERNLTTILEREESMRTTSVENPNRLTTFSYTPEIHAPPTTSRQQTPPVYSRILRKQAERENINEMMSETRSLTEVTDSSHAKYRTADSRDEYKETNREQLQHLNEPSLVSRRPGISSTEEDELYTRTITEKMTIEEIERYKRYLTEYRTNPRAKPDPKWDVLIRNYPREEPLGPPEWENFSDISSASNLTLANEGHRSQLDEARAAHSSYSSRSHTMDEDRSNSNSWYNLERVLEPEYATELGEQERTKWREIITTESTLRTLLTEAVVREDYESIKKDSRYNELFPEEKWDVIIRIINPPSAEGGSGPYSKSSQRYKRGKVTEWDNRSRRSSLPTLYEYDSDGGSSVRTLGQDHLKQMGSQGAGSRIRRLSSTRGGSEADLRSMSEMTVRDFARTTDRDDLTSLSSFEGESMVRSLSQPSLARSGSEFTEHWGVPSRNLPSWAIDDPTSSTESTPRPVRRSNRMESSAFDDDYRQNNANGTSSYTRSTTRYEKESRYMSQGPRRNSWYDSEPEMQI